MLSRIPHAAVCRRRHVVGMGAAGVLSHKLRDHGVVGAVAS